MPSNIVFSHSTSRDENWTFPSAISRTTWNRYKRRRQRLRLNEFSGTRFSSLSNASLWIELRNLHSTMGFASGPQSIKAAKHKKGTSCQQTRGMEIFSGVVCVYEGVSLEICSVWREIRLKKLVVKSNFIRFFLTGHIYILTFFPSYNLYLIIVEMFRYK